MGIYKSLYAAVPLGQSILQMLVREICLRALSRYPQGCVPEELKVVSGPEKSARSFSFSHLNDAYRS
jgi:hypothetical protein